MKKLIPVAIASVAILMACQSKSSNTQSNDSLVNSTKSIATATQCFQSIKNRDSAFLSLKYNDNQLTGSLIYNLYEKDKNNGTLTGIVKGDTIIADYTFQSEGTTSTRQVVWLKQNDQLIEGYGDVSEVDGKTKFKDISKLNFKQSIVFNKVDCK